MGAMTQQDPEVGLWREPVIPDFATTREQILWARVRPPGQRAAKPAAGDVVGLRLGPNGPVLRARVVTVHDTRPIDTRPGVEIDWNVWRYTVPDPTQGPLTNPITGGRMVELVDDPWWDVTLETLEGPKMRVQTREARLPGAAGWIAER